MANVFKNVTEVNNKVNKSTFDLSFQNNLTMQFGYLYPCFVKKFAPGTKVKIKPTFGLNFMPMMFPVQTRMRARMSFYKVRCRSLWKDYKDWFGNLKPNLVKPYIDFNSEDKLKKMASTGSLGDYLGLPTTRPAEDYGQKVDIPMPSSNSSLVMNLYGSNNQPITSTLSVSNFLNLVSSGTLSVARVASSTLPTTVIYNLYYLPAAGTSTRCVIDYSFKAFFAAAVADNMASLVRSCTPLFTLIGYITGENTISAASVVTNDPSAVTIDTSTKMVHVHFEFDINPTYADKQIAIGIPSAISINPALDEAQLTVPIVSPSASSGTFMNTSFNIQGTSTIRSTPYFSYTSDIASSNIVFEWNSYFGVKDWSPDPTIKDIDLETSPYYNSTSSIKDKQLMIDASFFRAYESIYNAYFRDIRNNPYILNGQPEYNVFIPSDAGGADDNIYELRRRNWESDFLTTAVPSPQQGRAPLVGITTYNDTTSLAFTAEDGKKYAVNYDYDPEAGEMKNVSFQQLGDDAVVKEARNMMDLVSSGISISDLRNVNAYTKFLELNMRKGYFYKDLVEGHFDTRVRYDELNMPEFIGGTAKDVFVNPVSQTVQTSQDGSYFGALGSYAGQASVQGSADNTISAYFDEECIVIGLISVVPVANYSQLLPKHFLHRELLDSYFPEFDNIGFQPIFYDEVCPIQAFNDDPDSLKDVFGYQRPWYDYVASTDEVHGLFRTNLRNFLINRVFASKPTLSPDFLLVDPEQVNDVFSVTQTTDKILGQIYFDVKVNAPISRIAIPRLD